MSRRYKGSRRSKYFKAKNPVMTEEDKAKMSEMWPDLAPKPDNQDEIDMSTAKESDHASAENSADTETIASTIKLTHLISLNSYEAERIHQIATARGWSIGATLHWAITKGLSVQALPVIDMSDLNDIAKTDTSEQLLDEDAPLADYVTPKSDSIERQPVRSRVMIQTVAKNMLKKHGIKHMDIVNYIRNHLGLNSSRAAVSRALDPRFKNYCRPHTIAKVRRACEILVPTMPMNVWDEYEAFVVEENEQA